jgi:hypothetical protein
MPPSSKEPSGLFTLSKYHHTITAVSSRQIQTETLPAKALPRSSGGYCGLGRVTYCGPFMEIGSSTIWKVTTHGNSTARVSQVLGQIKCASGARRRGDRPSFRTW